MKRDSQELKESLNRQKKELKRSPGNPKWLTFVAAQRIEIVKRLNKYNDPETIKNQYKDQSDLTHYQKYKLGVVSRFLRQALHKVEQGTYGSCEVGNSVI